MSDALAMSASDGIAWLSDAVTEDLAVEIPDLVERLGPELSPELALALVWRAGGAHGWVRARAFAETLLTAGQGFRRLLGGGRTQDPGAA